MRHPSDELARHELAAAAQASGLDVAGGSMRRTSSRFCLGVEHGDYNGTELFGVGTDRFLWIAHKGNDRGRVRLFSQNFPGDGVVEFRPGQAPDAASPSFADSWARFPFAVDTHLGRAGLPTGRGFDAVVFGNIPGGGMSRSASLTINLVLTMLEQNGVALDDGLAVVDLAHDAEHLTGSPCGKLDQTMICFARAGMGTHYRPHDRSIEHVPLGNGADLRFVSLDTGTVRPGLEKSAYLVRRRECEECVARIREFEAIDQLADVRDAAQFARIDRRLRPTHPHLADRLAYVFGAQQRFGRMLAAFRDGDVATVGAVFRQDGHELRDLYQISGPELETMCRIARTVPGVLGERMLGGGEKGAAGALVTADAVDRLRDVVARDYPRQHPELAERWSVHACSLVDGVSVLDGLAAKP